LRARASAMPHEIWVACCLVLVFEGMVLAAVPKAWQRMMVELSSVRPRQLRVGGMLAMGLGLICLKLVQG